MSLFTQLAFVVAILAYGAILSRLIPEKFHLPVNLTASTIFVWLALLSGLSLQDLGLGLNLFLPGLLVAIGASVVLIVSIFLVSKVRFFNRYFASSHSALRSSPSRIAYETAVRIPISTALTEEIIFRGVLLAVFLSSYSTANAIVFSSLVFGLWHVFPAINFTNQSYYLKIKNAPVFSKFLHIASNVFATAIAGGVFAWLRILSGSLLSPWLLHWVINSSALVSSLFATKVKSK